MLPQVPWMLAHVPCMLQHMSIIGNSGTSVMTRFFLTPSGSCQVYSECGGSQGLGSCGVHVVSVLDGSLVARRLCANAGLGLKCVAALRSAPLLRTGPARPFFRRALTLLRRARLSRRPWNILFWVILKMALKSLQEIQVLEDESSHLRTTNCM